MEEVLADVQQEGDNDPFAILEKEVSSESLPEQTPEKIEPKEGDSTPDNVPFHKHPRWIERERELESFRLREEETARELADLKAFKEETSKKFEVPTRVPDWFKELYGENEIAWQKFSEYDQQQRAQMKREVMEEQQQLQRQQAEEANYWNRWRDTELDKLRAEGHQFDTNKLIKTMLDYRPTDENNNFDFKRGLEIYQALEAKEAPVLEAKSNARKELGSLTTQSSKGEPAKRDYKTAKDLRNRSVLGLLGL